MVIWVACHRSGTPKLSIAVTSVRQPGDVQWLTPSVGPRQLRWGCGVDPLRSFCCVVGRLARRPVLPASEGRCSLEAPWGVPMTAPACVRAA